MLIEDGTGKGYKAGVNSEHRVLGDVVARGGPHHANHYHGDAYTMDLDSVVTDGASYWIAVIKNTDDMDLVICEVALWLATAHEDAHLEAWIGGTFVYAANGTAVVPTNMNAGSGRSATGEFYKNDGAGNITTLAGQAVCGRWLPKATIDSLWMPSACWVIPKNGVWALKSDKDGTHRGYIQFYYHSN